jgi:hypothetical protein
MPVRISEANMLKVLSMVEGRVAQLEIKQLSSVEQPVCIFVQWLL